ncbi:MAG TPA: type II toxin-antitoxin system HicA family toxin [Chthoniobacteraceae bacterium]
MKLPRDLTGADVAKALQRLGFVVRRQTGSHLILRREHRTVVVPQHRPVKPGTLLGILEQAGLTIEDLQRML